MIDMSENNPARAAELPAKAWLFAARKHQGQLYPGTGLPYLTHVGSVLLALLPALRAGEGWNAERAILCALLHDTVEDTATTLEEITGKKRGQ